MAQFPQLPLFTDAYLADTRHLSAQQHGAYLLLLMMAWRSPDCSIPDDDATLARWSSMDLRTWKKNRSTILAFWKSFLDKDGKQKWRQHRLLDERKRAEYLQSKNVAAGKISALKRKERGSTTVATESQHNVNPQTQTQSVNKLTDKKPPNPQGGNDDNFSKNEENENECFTNGHIDHTASGSRRVSARGGKHIRKSGKITSILRDCVAESLQRNGMASRQWPGENGTGHRPDAPSDEPAVQVLETSQEGFSGAGGGERGNHQNAIDVRIRSAASQRGAGQAESDGIHGSFGGISDMGSSSSRALVEEELHRSPNPEGMGNEG